ncbi:MAG: hypothetical protein LAT84_02485 [Balneolia bacterium]|nr:hypothetical protein [Balneolia bacterium]
MLMKLHIIKSVGMVIVLAVLSAFSACSIVGSSDSDELIISIEGQVFDADDTVTVQITNNYNHDVFALDQSRWSLQQKIGDEWQTIYAPIADTGPPRFSLFVEAGDVITQTYPALPDGAMYDPDHNKLRYVFGLFHEPDPNSPIPNNQRVTTTFQIAAE